MRIFFSGGITNVDLSDCYQQSGAGRYAIDAETFESWLLEIARRCLAPDTSPREIARFCRTLHVADLALARACAAGLENAWIECFTLHKQSVFRAACCITGDETRAHEAAQRLWTGLFCVDPEKPSKLASYTGRGTLESWLKAALFQSAVDLYRAERRFVSLEETLAPVCLNIAPARMLQTENARRVADALKQAIAQISAEQRFLLASYFLDGHNLLQIGTVLRVHESTVSRRIDKSLASVRRAVNRTLRAGGAALLAELDEEHVSDLAIVLSRDLQHS